MKFTIYDYDKRQTVEVKNLEKIWYYPAGNNDYVKRKVDCTSENGLSLKIQPAYDFCCGVREFGQLYISSRGNVPELRAAFIEAVEKSPLFRNIGALTYTRTKAAAGYSLQDTKEVEFIEQWPGASSGDWFYNPNSGNFVQQWTLPVNQDMQNQQEEEDEPDDQWEDE
jgi:hypothetical protein